MLKRKFRVTNSRDYNHIYKKGKRRGGKYIILFVEKNRFPFSRFGIVSSKKIGNAVVRNRARRQVSEVLKDKLEMVRNGYDVVIVLKKSIVGIDFANIEKDIRFVLNKADLL